MILRNIWKEAKGIGKMSFLFRVGTYLMASVLMVVHHVENNLPLTFLVYASVCCFLVAPQVFLYRYVRSGNSMATAIHDTTYDFFFAGWLIGILNVSILPSFVFGLGALTNYLGARGFHKLYRILLMPLGCILVLMIEGFQFHFESSTFMMILSLSYCVVHYCTNSYILYHYSFTIRNQNIEIERQQQEILAQSEELKVLNESLKNVNMALEVKVQSRTSELEVKNKKLEEYTFMNAHKLRAPVATILGLIHLFKYKEAIESETIIAELRKTSIELDKAIKGIQLKLEEENWESEADRPDTQNG